MILPDDILFIIFSKLYEDECALNIQRVWKGYRTRILVTRYTTLRYIKDFRTWNPNLTVYLQRSTRISMAK